MIHNSAKFKLFLISIIFISAVILAAVFSAHRITQDTSGTKTAQKNNTASLTMKGVRHTAAQNGIKQWTLNAKSAAFFNSENRAVFEDPAVTFFHKKKNAYLTAKHGILRTDSNNFEVSGDVSVKDENYLIETEALHYKHNERIIFTEVPAIVSGKNLNFKAASMSFNLDTDIIQMHGNVQGVINVQSGF